MIVSQDMAPLIDLGEVLETVEAYCGGCRTGAQ
jgi:hypothetical protein